MSKVIGLYLQVHWFNRIKGVQILRVINGEETTAGQPGLFGKNSQD